MTEYERGYMDGLRDRIAPAPIKHLTTKVKIIQDIVCDFFGLTMEDLKQRSKRDEIKHPRQVMCYFLITNTSMTLQAIGRIFDRDHTTVIYAKRKIEDLSLYDSSVKEEVEIIGKRVRDALDKYRESTTVKVATA
jgi:chromosomal replication initiator protein